MTTDLIMRVNVRTTRKKKLVTRHDTQRVWYTTNPGDIVFGMKKTHHPGGIL